MLRLLHNVEPIVADKCVHASTSGSAATHVRILDSVACYPHAVFNFVTDSAAYCHLYVSADEHAVANAYSASNLDTGPNQHSATTNVHCFFGRAKSNSD